MEIAIELLIIILVVGLLVTWAIWYKFTTWLANKRYNPDNDKSKQGEDARRRELEIEARKPSPSSPTTSSPGSVPTPGRELLPTTTPDDRAKETANVRETSNSSRKTRTHPFRRRK